VSHLFVTRSQEEDLVLRDRSTDPQPIEIAFFVAELVDIGHHEDGKLLVPTHLGKPTGIG
jgi:hypothetical protein